MMQKLHDKIEVIFEDLDLIVIDKAAGIVTYPVEGFEKDTAIQLIRQYWKSQNKQNSHLYLLHRIDKDTSGLLVFAKTSLARASLQKQFSEHSVVRQYVAATAGIPRKKNGRIQTMIGHDARGSRRGVSHRGKEAITEYRVLDENPSSQRALVACKLHTGRTHQIRIHLAHIGTPVIGDRVYGKDRSGQQLALHAQSLGFLHPRTRLPIVFHTSLPLSFKRLI